MAYYNKNQFNNNEEDENKLSFRSWKVFIDNTSVWFDEINKNLAYCYTDINFLKKVYPQIRSFASSRRVNLNNFDNINTKLHTIKSILYSSKYNELKSTGESGKWDEKLLIITDEVIQLLSIGLSDGELTPKPNKEKVIPYEKVGNVNDIINKSLVKNNNQKINKNGEITTNHN